MIFGEPSLWSALADWWLHSPLMFWVLLRGLLDKLFFAYFRVLGAFDLLKDFLSAAYMFCWG